MAKYKVTLVDGADRHSGTGGSVYEAFSKISPFTSKKMVNMEVVLDKKLSKIPLKLIPLKLKRIFNNEWEMRILSKRIETLR